MKTVTITGGTGLIGSALTKALTAKGYCVIILTRNAKPSSGNILYKEWDVEKGTIDESAITEADYIIHLAGANVADGRWTEKRKKEIVDSRVKSGKLLVQSLNVIPNKVQSIISSSAIGWYGPDRNDAKPFVETDEAYHDFLGQTCVQWEEAILPVVETGKRLVILRTGIVLSKEGGAYKEFKGPLKFRIATVLGSGKQVVSWIHIDDLVSIYIKAIEDEAMSGVYNAVAPNPVSNKKLILTIAKQKGFYIPVPVPSFALKMALGEMSIEVLKSATVSAAKITSLGYKFLYPSIQVAVENL